MVTVELDPLFLKALILLRSKSRESTEQLKALLDDVLGKKTKSVSSKKEGVENKEKNEKKDEKVIKYTSSVKKTSSEDRQKSSAKRPGEKIKLDPIVIKRMKTDIPSKKLSVIRKPVIDDDDSDDEDVVFKPPKSSSEVVINISSDSDDLQAASKAKKSSSKAGSGTETSDSTDMDDFALELGLACVICKKMDVSARNQLIECQECHNLYHQFCHKPAATDADANDPRLVWYCAKCQRIMRKSVDKKPSRSTSSDVTSPVGEKPAGEPAMNLFRRSEPKTPPASSVGKNQPFTGLANFAANVSGKGSSTIKSNLAPSKPSTIIGKSNIRVNMTTVPTKSSQQSVSRILSKLKSSSSGSRSPSPQPMTVSSKGKSAGVKILPQTSQATAMKRLQQMKKKASKR